MALDSKKIEQVLGRDVRQYVRSQDRAEAPEISSGLEYLLQSHWDSHGQSRWRWFDGLVLEETIFRVRKSNRLDVRGLMTWGESGTDSRQWVDVFAADLRLEDGQEVLTTYTLRLGRKGLEERKVPYGEYRELREELKQPERWSWAFVFTKGGK